MANPSLLRYVAATAALLSLLSSAQLRAAPLADNVRLVADSFASASAAPDAQTFMVTQAGTYTVKLTDLATPSALASLSVAVASSGATATQLTVTSPATTASADVTLAVGTYTVQPLAATAPGSAGSFTVTVTPSGGSTPLFVGPWAVAATAASSPAGQSVLHKQFTVSDTGNYQLTVTDRAFPTALSDLQVIVLSQPDGATQCTIVSLAAPSCSLTLNAGVTYDLIVISTADAAALQGLYSLKVVGGSTGTSTPYAATHPVGAMRAALNVPVASAGNVSLQFRDLMYPAPLGSASALVTQGADVVQPLALGANANIPASAGTLQVFVVATAAATPGMGAYNVYATGGAGTLLDKSVASTDSAHTSYSFATPLAAAGSYQFIVTDYLLPQPLVALDALAEQHGALLGTGVSPVATLTAAADTLNMIVFAPAPGTAPGGLFGIDLVSSTSGATLFQTTQGVGASFQTVDVVASAGKYVAQLTDLGYPADFEQVWLIGTGNRQVVTQILIGQSSPTGRVVFDVPSDGTYVINVLAQIGAGQHYGMYGFNLTAAPPAPVVTLTASAGTINSGAKTTLTWTSTDASSCTASDGWSGTVATSGSQDSAPLTADTTFTLTCIGDGGTTVASTVVHVTQPSSGSSGGGGAVDPLALLALATAVAAGHARHSRKADVALRSPSAVRLAFKQVDLGVDLRRSALLGNLRIQDASP